MQAVVTYESGKKWGDLPVELHRLGKALARGSNFKALADAAMESPNLKEAIESRICSNISKECKRLCSTANPSLLRGMTKEAMFNFSWEAVGSRGKRTADQSPSFPAMYFGCRRSIKWHYHYLRSCQAPWCLHCCSDFAEETR